MDECFPKNHPLNEILNKNTLKSSYSCMPNIQNIISSHNKLVLTKAAQQHTAHAESECNCHQKKETFKTRYLNHTSSFRNEKRKRATELSKHIWSLKQSNTRHSIRWKIIKKCQPYSNRTKRCNLSLYEKIVFICGFHGNNILCTMEHACCLHCPTCAKLQHFLSIICGDIPHFIDFI